jgi:hypothetical protein
LVAEAERFFDANNSRGSYDKGDARNGFARFAAAFYQHKDSMPGHPPSEPAAPSERKDGWISELAAKISASDPQATADPLYCVFQKRRIYGIDPEYTDNLAWVNSDECHTADDEEFAELEAEYQLNGEEQDGWRRVGYRDVGEFVTACFSDEGARDYIRINGHNLHAPFVYVASMYRNQEMVELRNKILEIGLPAPPKEG